MSSPDESRSRWTRLFSDRIYADRQTVFNLLAEVELWPAIIPHIRSTRVIHRDGKRRLIGVRAAWHGIPIGWRMIETVDVAAGEVILQHISPLTRGSIAVWSVGPTLLLDDGREAVDVTVSQRVSVPLPVIGSLVARWFVGGTVARRFGQKILDRVKDVAEGGSLAGRD